MAQPWKDRAAIATRGTQLGAIIAAMLGRDIPAPCFAGRASVTSDGFVMASFIDARGVGRPGAFVGSLSDLTSNLAGLSRHLKLSPEERAELATVATAWIASDWSNRAAAEIGEALR
jgi:hypothetical protein